MEVDYTARQVRITKSLRELAEAGMERVGKVLGKTARASITFHIEKHLQIAEITLKSRQQTLVAAGQAEKMEAALREALERIEHQAKRSRERQRDSKRLPKVETVQAIAPVSRQKARPSLIMEPENTNEKGTARSKKGKSTTAIPVHSFPQRNKNVESHIVRTGESIALKPMTIEQAVKDAEFRDRDLLIFRTLGGELFVLHRTRDGHMELVEIE